MGRQRWCVAVIAAAYGCAAPGVAAAAVYRYVDWTAADVAGGTASGNITLPDASVVNVTFAVTSATGGQGMLYGAQVDGAGINYWIPSEPYVSARVENPPPTTDILELSGGPNETCTLTLSEPIKDPIMAIVSLGSGAITNTYDFDVPFTIVSSGLGYWGGGVIALDPLPGDILQGKEGHGTIQFIGTFSTISWKVSVAEVWHGLTFGVRTAERLEPSADAGIDATPSDAGRDSGTAGAAGGGGTGGGAAGAGGGGPGGSATGEGGRGVAGTGGTTGTGGGAGVGGGAGGVGDPMPPAGRGGGGGTGSGGGCGCALGGDAPARTICAIWLLLAAALPIRRRRR